MAEAILFDFTKFVIGKLSSVVLDELKSALGVDDELERIESNLSSIQAVLRDAEKQQSSSESVKNWLTKLQDLMYDIDDLLDEIATEVAVQSQNKRQWRKQVRRFFSRSNFVVLRFLWAHQIKNLCKKLDRVSDERKSFVLSSEPVDSSESSSRETHSKVNESEVLGRDQDRDAIINSILSCGDFERISVFPIVGMGGLGKTTLAKLIYNDKRVDDNFDKKLWVYVSDRFNMKKILREVISMVTGENLVQLTMEQITLEQLKIKVCEALKDNKYFLMLDEMWNEDSNKWRRLIELLDVGAKGSMVVVTTRDSSVASMVKTVEEYRLSELSDETCLIIFKQLAFPDGDQEIEPALMSLAIEIVEKSRGIPLLVTALGKLLRGKTDEREWHLVVKKLEEGHEDIMNILKLSYEQLPSHLKRCFRFCSIFGKGKTFDPPTLVCIWMALGFLSFDNRGEPLESIESIGFKCIDKLSSTSLFQKIKHELLALDDFAELHMHDFVYDVAKSMAGDELEIIDGTKKEVSKNTRYIWLDEDYFSGNQFPERVLNNARKARLFCLKTSGHLLSKSFLQNIISNLKCLRVLELENCQFDKLPRTIGYMKHLRYVSLQNNLRIKLLPSSICNLLNLQTLLLDGCVNLQELPVDIGELRNLRFLSVTTQQEVLPQGIGFLTALTTLVLQECPRLAFLPLSSNQLENLDQLYIIDCKEFNLAHESCSLEGLNSLRKLWITGLPKFEKLPMGVKGLSFTSLHLLIISNCEGLTEVTDWIQYFTSLTVLVIMECPNLVKLPHTFSKPKNLEKMYIEGYPNLDNVTADEQSGQSG